MPETPTSSVNGHVSSAPALHASMSMLSFAPAATMLGCIGSTATAGSFCLFAENGDGGLPTLTSVSPPDWADARTALGTVVSETASRLVRALTSTARTGCRSDIEHLLVLGRAPILTQPQVAGNIPGRLFAVLS